MCKVLLGVLMSCVQISLGMMRSDIMLDQHCDSGIYCNWKQVWADGASSVCYVMLAVPHRSN